MNKGEAQAHPPQPDRIPKLHLHHSERRGQHGTKGSCQGGLFKAIFFFRLSNCMIFPHQFDIVWARLVCGKFSFPRSC